MTAALSALLRAAAAGIDPKSEEATHLNLAWNNAGWPERLAALRAAFGDYEPMRDALRDLCDSVEHEGYPEDIDFEEQAHSVARARDLLGGAE